MQSTWEWGFMAIKVNGKDMKDAVIKTEQFEMRLLEFTPDNMRISVKEVHGESFNFVPRFLSIVYPEKTINAKDVGVIAVGAKKTVEANVQFMEKLRIEPFMAMDLRYSRLKLATILVE